MFLCEILIGLNEGKQIVSISLDFRDARQGETTT